MQVPLDDSVCRFIRRRDWSTTHDKPKARSLKYKQLSVWHEARLKSQGATLNDLQFGSLEGSGQINLSVRDYFDVAKKVSSRLIDPVRVQVKWRPDDQFVTADWRPWRYAHAQVELVGTIWEHFPPAFRDLLIIVAKRKQALVPPKIEAKDS